MDTLIFPVAVEFKIKNSRFISELLPCSDQKEARELIREQKQRYADATHIVHAFAVGTGAEIFGMSDDGEPSGTAGRPVLDVLRGRNCTDTLLTVTRYFGGTLLGTGGLVKAYGDCAKTVIRTADEKNAFRQFIRRCPFSFSIGYPLYKPAERLLTTFDIDDLSTVFDTDVRISGKIRVEETRKLADRIFDLSAGKTRVHF
ncbi:MAG: YigZ family protein [Treponema sp.]|jgi:uncharacterized YigZ family protein|nr:YigZ family protein [Treponema sp.]